VIGLYINHNSSDKKTLHIIDRIDAQTVTFESANSKILLTITAYNPTLLSISGIFLNNAAYDYEDSAEFFPGLVYKIKKNINKFFPSIFRGY
jgi:hypothetical protein